MLVKHHQRSLGTPLTWRGGGAPAPALPAAMLRFASHSPLPRGADGAFLGATHSGLVLSTLPSTERGWGLARKPWRQASMDCCCSGRRAHSWPQTLASEPTHVRFSPAEKQQPVLGGQKPPGCWGTHGPHDFAPCSSATPPLPRSPPHP